MPPMRKPPTGEPCAGKPHARFGGRGGEAVPTPIAKPLATFLYVSGYARKRESMPAKNAVLLVLTMGSRLRGNDAAVR